MNSKILSSLAVLLASRLAAGAEVHGQGVQGTTMGPVAFLWPADRPWNADADNTAPCGSNAGPSNRTIFPLQQGSVSLSIADDAWNVAFSISYENDPKTQSAFTQQVVKNISSIEPGHQCYKLEQLSSAATAGSNATIQLEYWSSDAKELSGRNQSFYACADITFVETVAFDLQIACFNVTSSEFELPAATTSSVPSATNAAGNTSTSAAAAASGGDGLSTGAKAGIAVGVILASLITVGAVAFLVLRRRRSQSGEPAVEAVDHKVPETSSINSVRR